MKKLLSLSVIILVAFSLKAQDFVKHVSNQLYTNDEHIPNTVIIKIKDEFRARCSNNYIDISAFNNLLVEINATELFKLFPNQKPPERKYNAKGQKLADLSLIYEIKYNSNVSVEEVINKIQLLKIAEYAVPRIIEHPLYNPNDPYAVSPYQSFLGLIKAYEAWDITKGNDSVVIGIVDTGTDLSHEDLSGNIKYNANDPIDGIDNDGDGYTDNFLGWDVADNINWPQYAPVPNGDHGVYVSGVASATTDNGKGIAGVGFNCKFLPVKVMSDGGVLAWGYDGIVYAAEHGCQIINCSWGSTGSYNPFNQDVITYATINKNALVIAAAGNSNNENLFYPASYDYVISVASSTQFDAKCSLSSYNYSVDVCATAESTYTTKPGGYGYPSDCYTSMASPVCAGCAALVKAQFPEYDAIQISEKLKVTADIIDILSWNEYYRDKLGYGRINCYRAVTDTTLPSIRLIHDSITDLGADIFLNGDTLYISGNFINYLYPATNITCTLSFPSLYTDTSYIEIMDSTTVLGPMGTYEEKNNYTDPFRIRILPSTPINEQIYLKLSYYDDGHPTYYGFDIISFVVNKDYIDITINDLKTTITSKGWLGYNNAYHTQGLGVCYQNYNSLLYAGGFMLGNSITKVSDGGVYNETLNYDNDFAIVDIVDANIPGFSDFDCFGKFNDDNAGANKLDVLVRHNAYAWQNAPHNKYVIVEYIIKNNGTSALSDLYAGIYMDFDVYNYDNNYAAFDIANRLGYTYSIDTSIYVGVQLLTDDPVHCYAVTNDGSGGSISIYDGFTAQDKYTTLSTDRWTSDTNDVSQTISSGPLSLNVGDSVTVAFAIIAGESLADIQQSAVTAEENYKFRIALTQSSYIDCYGNCNGSATVTTQNGIPPFTYLWNDTDSQTTPTATGLCSGTYTVTVTDANNSVRKDSITINQPDSLIATITNVTQMLCLSDTNATATVTQSGGTPPYIYLWNDPDAQMTQTATGLYLGTYQVNVTDFNGCIATAFVDITDTIALKFTFGGDPVIACDTTCAGFVSATASDGVPPYNYLWSPTSDTTDFISGLCPGIYTITITDNNGCVLYDSIEVINAPPVFVNFPFIKHVTCYGLCNGIITATGIQGTPPYEYEWNTTPTQYNQTITNLCPDTYTVIVTDSKNCQDTGSVTITQPDSLIASVDSLINTSCCDLCDGKAFASATGGTPTYYYLWNDQYAQTTSVATALCADTFVVRVKDVNNCIAYDTIIIDEPSCITINLSSANPLCYGDSTGIITSVVSGGTPPYAYLWTPTDSTTPNLDSVPAGSYILTVTDSNNCIESNAIILSQPPQLNSSIINVTHLKCYNECEGKATATATGGTSPYAYLWSPSGNTGATADSLCTGTHTITITDAHNCILIDSVTLQQPTELNLTLTVTQESAPFACDGSVVAVASGGTPPYIHFWGFDTILADTSSIYNLCSGNYTIILIDSNGCSIDSTITINYDMIAELENSSVLILFQNIPNPASDRSLISFYLPDEYNTTLSIYNLIGKEIKQIVNTNLSKGMYTYNIDVSSLQEGVYFYRLKAGNYSISRKMVVIRK